MALSESSTLNAVIVTLATKHGNVFPQDITDAAFADKDALKANGIEGPKFEGDVLYDGEPVLLSDEKYKPGAGWVHTAMREDGSEFEASESGPISAKPTEEKPESSKPAPQQPEPIEEV